MVKNRKKSAVKNSIENPVLLNFVNLSPPFCPRLSHNKIHPVTNYKAIKNRINKTRQHRTSFFFNKITTTKTHTHTEKKPKQTTTKKKKKKEKKKEKEMKLLAPAPLPFHIERSINQSYDQWDAISLLT